MTAVSLPRLYVLRAVYLLVAAGLLATVWPPLLSHRPDWPLMNGVVCSLLATVSLLALLGLRYPLQMLPVLLFELAWKAIWLVAVAWPLWRSGSLDPERMETVRDCLPALILIPAIPWRYVFARYVKAPGEPWTNSARAEA